MRTAAIDRRRGTRAHLLHPAHGQLQVGEYGRKGQNMDVRTQRLEALLLDAEMLLFIDNQ